MDDPCLSHMAALEVYSNILRGTVRYAGLGAAHLDMWPSHVTLPPLSWGDNARHPRGFWESAASDEQHHPVLYCTVLRSELPGFTSSISSDSEGFSFPLIFNLS